MSLYKVWNASRSVRKLVKAESLQELITKGKEKIGIAHDVQARLVLNGDGTDIDEEELLEHFKDEVLILLEHGSSWQEANIMQITMVPPPSVNQYQSTSTDFFEIPSTSATSTVVEQKQTSPPTGMSTRPVSQDMPPPNKIELPEFSPNTIMLLNQKHEKAEKAVLAECSVYYHTKYPELKSSDYYQSIGKQLVTKFPFLAYEGNSPWTYMTQKISSRIRQLRVKENKKTSSATMSSDSENPVKKFRFQSLCSEPDGEVLQHHIMEEKLQNIEEEWNGSRQTAQIKILMLVTRPNRKLMIQRGMTMAEIMETFPPFEDSKYIMDDFCSVVNKENPSKASEDIHEKKTLLFEKVVSFSKDIEDDYELEALRYLEDKLAIVQGKGTKSKRVLSLLEVNTVDIPEEELTKLLKTKPESPLSIRLLTVDSQPKLAYLVGGGHHINCNTASAMEAVVVLLGAYYVFHLNYPAIYGQLLGFLQQYILSEPYPFFKGTNFKKFAHKMSHES